MFPGKILLFYFLIHSVGQKVLKVLGEENI